MNKFTSLFASLLVAVLAMLPIGAMADEGDMTFSYDTGKGTVTTFGTSKKENYNVAMSLSDKALVGAVIKSVRIPMGTVGNISNLKVWLTKELNIKTESGKKVNDADILTQTVDAATGWIDVELSSPYTITDEGVYVGYSFDIDASDDTNLAPIEMTTETHDGGFYIFTSRTYRKWMDKSATGSLTMQVVVSGMSGNAASVTLDNLINTEVDKTTSFSFDVNNCGYNGVKSLDYQILVTGPGAASSAVAYQAERHVALGSALPSSFNYSTTINTAIPSLSENGQYSLTITITKVNDEANGCAAPSATASLNVYNVLPTHRPLMEEYTGTWCGWCTRGFLALELMNNLYPDDFVALAYHNSDAMEIMSSSLFPANIEGFPSAVLERTYEVDPYYGTNSSSVLGIENDWKTLRSSLAPANLNVTASLDETNSKVAATADLVFPMSNKSANYSVEFALVADSLCGTGSSWNQSNYYPSYASSYANEKYLSILTTYPSTIEGLKFNDVIIASTRLTGDDVALPTEIEGEATYTATAEFELSKAVNTSGESLVQNINNLRVVAILIDKSTGAAVNSNKCKVVSNEATGISATKAETTVGNAAIYDLSGRRIDSVVKGVNIVKTADGRTMKVLRK